MNVSGGAVTRDAVNKNEAVRLLQFLSGDLAQNMYAQVNHEYPVKEGDSYSGIVSSFGSSQEGVKKGIFKQDKRNLSEIGSYRKKAIQILDEVNYDKQNTLLKRKNVRRKAPNILTRGLFYSTT